MGEVVRPSGALGAALSDARTQIGMGARATGKGVLGSVAAPILTPLRVTKDIVELKPRKAVSDVVSAVCSPLRAAAGLASMAEAVASVPVGFMKHGGAGKPGLIVGNVASAVYQGLVGGMVKDLAYGNSKQQLAGVAQAAMFMLPMGAGAKAVDAVAEGAVGLAKGARGAVQAKRGIEGAAATTDAARASLQAAKSTGTAFLKGDQEYGVSKMLHALKPGGAGEATAKELATARRAVLDLKTPGERLAALDASLLEKSPELKAGSKELTDARNAAIEKAGLGTPDDVDGMKLAKYLTTDMNLTRSEAAQALVKTGIGEGVRQAVPMSVAGHEQTAGDHAAEEAGAKTKSGRAALAYAAIQTAPQAAAEAQRSSVAAIS